MENPRKKPLIVIVGPTASGKTGLSIRMAKKFGGEIISADSRAIYRHMDVGTAKPTLEERQGIPHWGIDLIEPNTSFSAAEFKKYTQEKIEDIRMRGKIPILVGGTGLYVDAVIFDYDFSAASVDGKRRERLLSMSLDELHTYCKLNSVQLPENKLNKRYIVRAIEQGGINQSRRSQPIENSIIVGITTDRQTLRTRIEYRAEQIFELGVVEEATQLAQRYGWDSEAMTGNIYPLVRRHLEGEIDEEELKQKFIVSDWRLAKRQLTWLKRNKYIQWYDIKSAEQFLSQKLAQFSVS